MIFNFMKLFLSVLLLTVSSFSFAQNANTISGIITDAESDNAPLLLAKVTLKETGQKALTNETGVFRFENIAQGTYTLVCSFTGYETKEIVATLNAHTNIVLHASSLSLDDLTLAFAASASKMQDDAVKHN